MYIAQILHKGQYEFHCNITCKINAGVCGSKVPTSVIWGGGWVFVKKYCLVNNGKENNYFVQLLVRKNSLFIKL